MAPKASNLDAVRIERFGLNFGFIEEHDLTWINNLLTGGDKDLGDPNHGHHWHHDVQDYIKRFGTRKVEAEALVVRPEAGRELCKAAILEYIDEDGVDEYRETVDEKREEMRQHLAQLMGGDQ